LADDRSPEAEDGVQLLLEPDAHPATRPFKEALVPDGMPYTSFAVDDCRAEYGFQAAGVAFIEKRLDMGPVTTAVFDDTEGLSRGRRLAGARRPIAIDVPRALSGVEAAQRILGTDDGRWVEDPKTLLQVVRCDVRPTADLRGDPRKSGLKGSIVPRKHEQMDGRRNLHHGLLSRAPDNRRYAVAPLQSVLHLTHRLTMLPGMPADSGSAIRELAPRRNVLLRAMPEDELARLVPHLERVDLPRPTVLDRPNEEIEFVYFPTSGMASIVANGEGGESVDTAMVGREGMTGLAVYLGTGQMPVQTMVQVPMTGFRLPSDVLRAELERNGALVNLLSRYTQVVMVSMAQLILCNRVHRLDQRAARWLLQVDERVDEAPFDVTQEFLAQMIGTQRPSISLAVRQFKDAGLIMYSRGRIVITDRDGLRERSCGCIDVIHDEERRLRDTPERHGAPPS
jgi:CRP-like cAMP-binding protein